MAIFVVGGPEALFVNSCRIMLERKKRIIETTHFYSQQERFSF